MEMQSFSQNRSFCNGNASGNSKNKKNPKNPMLRHTMADTCPVCIVCLNIGFFGFFGFFWFFGFFGFPDAFPLQNERFRENDCISITKSTISLSRQRNHLFCNEKQTFSRNHSFSNRNTIIFTKSFIL